MSNFTILKETNNTNNKKREQSMNSIEYKKNGYIFKIAVLIAVCYSGTTNIIYECETMREAKQFAKENDLTPSYWYLAAEIINEDGDLNPAVWGKSREEAVGKLKKLL